MHELSIRYPNLNSFPIAILSQTLCLMASGCLQELTLTPDSRYDIKKISNIISLETSSLIKNSALLGFVISRKPNSIQMNLLSDIGDKVGYLFQAMNDLEPFSSYENISIHKGRLNTDFERSRKNLIVTYIYGMCSVKEKQRLLELKNTQDAVPYMLSLYQKYNILKIVQDDLKEVENQVEYSLDQLVNQQINKQCLDEFHVFFTEIIKLAKDRLFTNNNSEID